MKVKRLPRWVKILLALVGALVALCLTLAVVTLLIMDNDDYRALAVWGTEHLAECRMVIDGTFEVEWSQTFSITATGLRFEPLPGDEGPSLTAVGRFHTRIALAPLLRGILVFRDLEIDNARLSHDVQDEPADEREPSRGGPFAFFTPIVERAALQNIQFHLTGNRTGLSENLVVHALTLESNRTGEPLGLQVDGRFNTDEFHIEGQLGVLYADLKTNRPFPIDLEISIADLQANVSGAIDHPFEGKGFNLKFAIEEQEVSNILRVFKFNSPPLGRFTLEAELAGDIETLRITDLDLKVSNGTTIQMSVEGSVPDLATGRGIDLQLSQEIRHYNVLQRIFPADWKVVETFRFKAALRNENGDYIVDDIDVLVANDKGIAITTNGRLRLGNPFGGSFLKAVDLKIHLTSPDTAGIKPLLTDAIPEIGAVQARARLVGPIDRLALEELFIDRGGSGPVQVTTRGRIGWIPLEEDLPLEDMDLTISIQAQRSKILREFYEVPIGEIGTVDLTGQIVGSSRRFKLQNVKLRSKTAEGLEALVTGGIDFVRGAVGPAIGDVGFKLRFEAPTLEIAEPIMGVSIMRSLGPIRGQVDVNGTTEALSFDNILVTGGRSGRLYVDWRGRIKKIPLIEGEVLSGQETSGTLSAARSSDFAALFGVTLADVGPVRGSWRDTDHEGIVGMSDIKVVIGDGKTFDLQVNGAIAEIVDLNKDREEIEIQWINFQFELNTSDSHGIAKLIGVAMPDLGALNGRWTISGGEKSLAVRNVSLTSLSSGGLKTQTTGSVGHIAPEAGGALKDVDLQFTGKAPDFRAVPGLGGLNLPALGPLRVEAHLKDQDGALNLDRLTIHTGDEDKPTLRLQGRIDRIQDWERMDFQADFETLAQPWLQMLLKDPVTESPVLQGALRIGRIDDGWRIDKFKLGTREQGGLSMEGAGTIRMEGDSPSVDMQIFSKMADPSAWGRLFDVSLPSLAPTQITGWYRENENRHQFSGEIRLGDSRFQTDFNASTHDRKPVIEATLAAQTLRLQDLGFYPQSQPSASPSTPAPHAENPPRLFDEEPLPLEILQDFDLSLKILADQIISREIAFKQIGLDLTVKDGRLQIGPITAKYLNGDATIDATIDTNETPPVMALNMAVEDADIEEVLTSVDRPLILGGQLTLFADLHSSGRSAHEIAAHLQGETGFVIEHGRIKREIELMASDALDFLFTGPASQTYTALNCTAFRMRFKEGTGTIQVFFVETPGMRAEAYGHVDLADETIALVVNPTSKRRLIRRSSPVRIKGSLQDPSIVKVPVEEAAILAGQIFVPYVALPARALGYLWSLIKRDKDEENTCFLPPETDP